MPTFTGVPHAPTAANYLSERTEEAWAYEQPGADCHAAAATSLTTAAAAYRLDAATADHSERFFEMMDNPDPTRRYTIEIKDLVSNQTVMLTAVDWTDTEQRIAMAQITRIAKAPAANCFAALVVPDADQP